MMAREGACSHVFRQPLEPGVHLETNLAREALPFRPRAHRRLDHCRGEMCNCLDDTGGEA